MKITPYTFWQSFDDDGEPLAGGKLYTYAAGTSTPKATYTDSGGGTANTNPIILDSDGRANIWLDTGAYKFVLTDSDDVSVGSTIDNITGDTVNVFGSSVEDIAVNTNITSSYQNVIINCTAVVTLSLLDSATAGEGFVFSVRNSSAGDVTIEPDGLELIDGSASLILGSGKSVLIDNTGTGWLSMYLSALDLASSNTWTGTNTFNADVNMVGAQFSLYKGADVASATELPIITDGNYFDVTGTTAITSIATTGNVGTIIKLHFDGILTLTHDATALILPSGDDITTAAGDEAEFIEFSSGNFRCTNYMKASGTAVLGSAFDDVGCSVYQTATTSIANGGWTAVLFDTEAYDDDTWHSTSTNTSRITFDFTGRVHIDAGGGHVDVNNGVKGARLMLNGATEIKRHQVNSGGTSAVYSALSRDLDVTPDDYIELELYNNSGAADNSITGVGGCQLQVRRIK